MAVNEQGQLFAWGAGDGGQLGLGTTETTVRIPRCPCSLQEEGFSLATQNYTCQ